jgi:hypothetical protein
MMTTFLQKLRTPKNKLGLMLLAGVLLLMQCYLFQHEISHAMHDHEHETVQECQLCIGAQHFSHVLVLDNNNIMPVLVWALLIGSLIFVSMGPLAFLLPHTRAPPRL